MTQSLHATVWYLFIIWLQNLTRAMHVYLTTTSSMCKTQWHATQCLSYSSWSHVAHVEALSRPLAWIDHSDVLLVPEECTRPPWAALAVHARSENVHARHTRTHSVARTHRYTGGRNFVPRSTSCDNLTRVKSFTLLMAHANWVDVRAEEIHYYSTARMQVVKSWVASSTSIGLLRILCQFLTVT